MSETNQPKVMTRVQRLALEAIGQRIRLQTAEHEFISGTISACKFVAWDGKGPRQKAKFFVQIQAGTGESYKHEYHVFVLPNISSNQLLTTRVSEFKETTLKVHS